MTPPEIAALAPPRRRFAVIACMRREALFASGVQPSGTLTAETVAEAISCAVRRLGAAGCRDRMAQEFGDHPDVAAGRMRWVCKVLQASADARPAVTS